MVSLLNELHYAPGQQKDHEDTIILPSLQAVNLLHAISIGPESKNMAQAYNVTNDDLVERQNIFLTKNHLSTLPHAYISYVPQSHEPVIQDITEINQTGGAIQLPAEGLFTTLRNTPLIHKPADCPTAIIYAKKDDAPVLGLAHLGRPQVNKRVTEQAIDHVTKVYSVHPQDIYIGISPSIGPKHYFLKAADQEKYNFIDKDYWGDYAREDTLENEAIIRIDVLGKILSVLEKKGISSRNIEAYGHNDAVDTYELASLTPPLSFSHRFATETQQPERNGRIMVASQL